MRERKAVCGREDGVRDPTNRRKTSLRMNGSTPTAYRPSRGKYINETLKNHKRKGAQTSSRAHTHRHPMKSWQLQNLAHIPKASAVAASVRIPKAIMSVYTLNYCISAYARASYLRADASLGTETLMSSGCPLSRFFSLL